MTYDPMTSFPSTVDAHTLGPPAGDEPADPARVAGRTVAQAVAHGELRLLYQPIVRVADRAVVAVEALVRWQHPTLGLISPDRFLPAAEHGGHLPLLDRWVLHRACRDMVELDASLGDAVPAHVNVNLSAPTLATDFTELVTTALRRTGLAARRLRLELSEGADLQTLVHARPCLEKLIERGIGVALDDMGAGATDLRYLSRLAVQGIKIDKEFVAGMLHNPRDHAIVRMLTELARSLGLHVTAEGVETGDQLTALGRLGVPYAQGYHLALPLALPALTATLLAA
ncbi:EAL domain-containing protein [Catellatospora sichuanensis]|uniref:EAL domain-containing protein n=1 Tax=Catellatospora sichuanensis TaxID=1969805 RepID=UPI001642FC95|nr:EAL domain-containing protein [Catellatospora sichuanensis]